MQKLIFELIYLLILSLFDLWKKKVPVVLLVIGWIFGIVFCCLEHRNPLECVIGIGMVLIACVTKKAGCADGLAIGQLGLMYGLGASLFSFAISLFVQSFVCIALLILKKVNRNSKIPYLPFLLCGVGVCFLMGGMP